MRDAARSFAAEWLKLRRRPAVWVLGAILVALVLVVNYVFLFLLLLTTAAGTEIAPGMTAAALKQMLYPANFIRTALSNLSGGGLAGSLAMILGALTFGSEYGWGTLKTVLAQRPGRLATFAGKLVALAAVLAIYTALMFAAAAACAAAIGAYDGSFSSWPQAADVVKGVLAGWLIMGLWASLGLALSILFRQSALAIGLGLVYAIVLEVLVFGILGQLSWTRTVQKGFPGANATALVQSFGSSLPAASSPAPLVDATQAGLVLIAYVICFTAIGAALLHVRDVT